MTYHRLIILYIVVSVYQDARCRPFINREITGLSWSKDTCIQMDPPRVQCADQMLHSPDANGDFDVVTVQTLPFKES